MIPRARTHVAALLLALASPAALAQDEDWLAAAEAELAALEAEAAGADEAGADGGETAPAATAGDGSADGGDGGGSGGGDGGRSGAATGSGAGSAPSSASPSTAAPSTDWQHSLDRVADLLIADRPRDAQAAALRLLDTPGLPPDVEARARELLATARRHLAVGLAGAAGYRTPGSGPGAPSRRSFPSASFPVVQARVGAGFAAGEAGSLRIDSTGISFVAKGRGKPQWGVAWARVVDLTPHAGLWDTRHPLVLRQSDGSARYLALLDGAGGHPPPARLLDAFERARRVAQGPRKAAASASAGKEQPR